MGFWQHNKSYELFHLLYYFQNLTQNQETGQKGVKMREKKEENMNEIKLLLIIIFKMN